MFTEEEIKEKGYERIGENLYKKNNNLFVQSSGELKLASFLSEEELKEVTDLAEYKKELNKIPQPKKKEEKKETKESEKGIKTPSDKTSKTKKIVLRGTEKDIVRLMDADLQLDSIIEASKNKDKLGEGLLWHELVFTKKDRSGKVISATTSVEPSAELVDMIVQDMGNITTEIIDFNTNIIEDPNSKEKYMTYYCVVQATDKITGTTGLGAAEQIIDFNEIRNKGRTFARTNAIRKAERNAKERLIPIPRAALVNIIVKKLKEHSKKK